MSLVKKGARVCVTGKERGRECVSLVKREGVSVCHCQRERARVCVTGKEKRRECVSLVKREGASVLHW